MKLRNYLLVGLIYIAISMLQYSYVQASQLVSDEIEKFVSPAEEIQINELIQQDLSEPPLTDIEEQPDVNDDKNAEQENTIQKKNTDKEQTIPEKKISDKPKQENVPVQTLQTNENSIITTIPENPPISEQKAQKHYLSLSKYFNKCKNFFSGLSFNKIIALKEIIIKYLSLNQYIGKICRTEVMEFKQITYQQQFLTPKDVIPYYFLYSEPLKTHLEKIAFTDKITNPREFLPLNYTVKNYEVNKLDVPKNVITPQGTTNIRVLINAPSPEIEVTGKPLLAKLVVDIRNNTLYKYDEDGFPLKAYLVATGARGSRTMTGLRIVTHKEKFPYKGAPINTKRLFDPYSYGPYIIFMNAVNPKTGRQSVVDQFLHGNGNENSIGKKVSHGCMRTNNNVMRNELSKEIKRGDYILLINPDIY